MNTADNYFMLTTCVYPNTQVLYQVFAKRNGIFCGEEMLQAILYGREYVALQDGDPVRPYEPVLYYWGKYGDVGRLETALIGTLARLTRVATNVREAVRQANSKPVYFFAARFDIPEAQRYDGYAAGVGGANGVSTAEQCYGYRFVTPTETMPHAYIVAAQGDTVQACLDYKTHFPHRNCWALVDFENDCAATATRVFEAFRQHGLTLTGVRLDTSESMVDASLVESGQTGVNVALVRKVREALDAKGGKRVQICVSGGFTPDKIRAFEEQKAPVDAYGVGEYFLSGSFPFTSDAVLVQAGGVWTRCAKAGRSFTINPLLEDRLREKFKDIDSIVTDKNLTR